jgi:hypothetical protein
MGDHRSAEEHADLPTFIMLYQEPVGSQSRVANCGGTHTAAREQVDDLQLETRTDTEARESADPGAVSHVTFPLAAGTETFSRTRENVDSDVSHAYSLFRAEGLTKTGTREQDDTDLRPVFSAIPRGIETQTHSKDAREQADPDISQSVFTTFPPRA